MTRVDRSSILGLTLLNLLLTAGSWHPPQRPKTAQSAPSMVNPRRGQARSLLGRHVRARSGDRGDLAAVREPAPGWPEPWSGPTPASAQRFVARIRQAGQPRR